MFGARFKENLNDEFVLIGHARNYWACWISPLDVRGRNRIKCNMMNVLSLIGPVTDFQLNKFQNENKGLLYLLSL